jgi:hypothetical protein
MSEKVILVVIRVAEEVSVGKEYPIGTIIQYWGTEPPQGWIVYPGGEPIPEQYKPALQRVGYGDVFPKLGEWPKDSDPGRHSQAYDPPEGRRIGGVRYDVDDIPRPEEL